MARKRPPIISCELSSERERQVRTYIEQLVKEAPSIGGHGLSREEFWESGLFKSAVERLRGQQAASMSEKREFMESVLDHLRASGKISSWVFTGSDERHDYEIRLRGGRTCIVETKGCLDGNNTNIYERPPQADEFVIWSLCQNPGADPRKNAWSGIHTRLGAEIIHRRQRVDGVVIWDMVCGSAGRPCPKLQADPSRSTKLKDLTLPPPCLYLLPRTVPDPRNNQNPPSWSLQEVGLLHALHDVLKGDASDVVEVRIEARMKGPDIERKTCFYRGGVEVAASEWAPVKRARR